MDLELIWLQLVFLAFTADPFGSRIELLLLIASSEPVCGRAEYGN
jgi:hypothetical protein